MRLLMAHAFVGSGVALASAFCRIRRNSSSASLLLSHAPQPSVPEERDVIGAQRPTPSTGFDSLSTAFASALEKAEHTSSAPAADSAVIFAAEFQPICSTLLRPNSAPANTPLAVGDQLRKPARSHAEPRFSSPHPRSPSLRCAADGSD